MPTKQIPDSHNVAMPLNDYNVYESVLLVISPCFKPKPKNFVENSKVDEEPVKNVRQCTHIVGTPVLHICTYTSEASHHINSSTLTWTTRSAKLLP